MFLNKKQLIEFIKLNGVLFITQIAFSTVNVFGKIVLDRISPLPFIALRSLSSAPCAFLIAFILERQSLYESIIDLPRTALRIGLGIAFPHAISMVLYLYGLQLSNPINCGILWLAMVPVTAIMGMIVRYEQRRWLKVLGILFSVGGSLVMLELDKFSFSNETVVGDILVLCNVVFYAIYLVFTKKLSDGMGSWTMSFWMMLFGGLLCALPVPFFLLSDVVPVTYGEVIEGEVWGSLVVVTFIGTTFTYLCTNWALHRSSSLVVAVYSPLEMVSTIVLSVLILGAEVVWVQGVGAACVVCGLLIVLFSKWQEEKEEGRTMNGSTRDTKDTEEVPDEEGNESTSLMKV